MFSTELPKPILFHPLKHHLGYIIHYIHNSSATTISKIREDLQTLGTSQLDLYSGPLMPLQIAEEVISCLQEHELLQPESFEAYLLAAKSDYRCITLSDTTDWVLRRGLVEGRHVHLHPARYATHTLRVKANALKTAIAAVIAANKCGARAVMDTRFINEVRTEWLALPPVKDISLSEGLGNMIMLLQKTT